MLLSFYNIICSNHYFYFIYLFIYLFIYVLTFRAKPNEGYCDCTVSMLFFRAVQTRRLCTFVPMASSSSIKIMAGVFSFARANASLTSLAPSPINIYKQNHNTSKVYCTSIAVQYFSYEQLELSLSEKKNPFWLCSFTYDWTKYVGLLLNPNVNFFHHFGLHDPNFKIYKFFWSSSTFCPCLRQLSVTSSLQIEHSKKKLGLGH